MTHTPEQLDAIIAGLSEPRNRFLMACSTRPKKWRTIRRHAKGWHGTHVRGMIAPLGLVELTPLVNTVKISPLGQAVRARMMEVK